MLFSISSELPSLQVLLVLIPAAYAIYFTSWIIYSRFFHPYHDIPGPFLASITTWWRWYAVRYSVYHNLQHALHEKYGPLVRITPEEVSISDPYAIDIISRPDFVKTEFYSNFDPGIGGRPEPFAERNEQIHTKHRKIITPLFRSEVIFEYEGYVDRILDIFNEKMEDCAKQKTVFDLAEYVSRYTWDTVGDMVYSHEGGFGFLQGEDYMGWMEMLRVMPQPISSLGYVPYGLGRLYFLSMLAFSPGTRKGLVAAMTVVKQVKSLVQKRKDEEASGSIFRQNDMLSKMMTMTRDEKVDFNEDDIAIILNAFVWAGSDTTGSTLAMIMYFILSNPQAQVKLLAELSSATKSDGQISYATASRLPYLKACIDEGMRLHFIIGTGLPRYVPPSGATICGRRFPGGYKVVMNMAVMQADQEIFGGDAHVFRPERWLDGDPQKIKRMHKYFHPWGVGTRICQGKWVALMELHKFVARVLPKWEFEFTEKEWERVRVNTGYMQQPEGIMVRVRRRGRKA